MVESVAHAERNSAPGRFRLALIASALVLVGVDAVVKAVATRTLQRGTGVDLGPLQLRLAYNPGVAFSMGANLPSAALISMIAAVVAVLVVFAWRVGPFLPVLAQGGLVLLVGGALGNLVDRLADGVVTDYLHTGWWPTFNFADVFVSTGMIAVIATQLFMDLRRPQPEA